MSATRDGALFQRHCDPLSLFVGKVFIQFTTEENFLLLSNDACMFFAVE